MSRSALKAVLVGALAVAPMAAFAAPPSAAPAKAPTATHAKATMADHATTGIVKSIDATTLVINRDSKSGRVMTFALEPSTQKEGSVDVGANVSVRYREQGKMYIATAVTVQRSAATHKRS